MKLQFKSQGSLADDLAKLPDLDRQQLMEEWRKLYANEPPLRISQNLMIRAIAYKIQEKALGGLKPATRKFLSSVIENIAESKSLPPGPLSIKPGTRFIREWHGSTYEVLVQDQGVLFQGKQYKSLSEVARAITGVRWSGPLFFGLKGKVA